MLCDRIGFNIAAFNILKLLNNYYFVFGVHLLLEQFFCSVPFLLFLFFMFGFMQFQKIVHCATSFIQMGVIIHIYAKIPELKLIHTLYIIAASSIQRSCCWEYNDEPEYTKKYIVETYQ